MSWDRTEYTETAICACGKGTIVRLAYIEDDDWNRTQGGIISEEICCTECKEKIHIEHYIQHYFCPPWKGDGIMDRTYLVYLILVKKLRRNRNLLSLTMLLWLSPVRTSMMFVSAWLGWGKKKLPLVGTQRLFIIPYIQNI